MRVAEKLVPELRFSGFEGEWNERTMTAVSTKITDGTHDTPEKFLGTPGTLEKFLGIPGTTAVRALR